jgi:hypothetical protein
MEKITMMHRYISLPLMSLFLVHVPLTHAFNLKEYVVSACGEIATTMSSIGDYACAHPVITTAVSMVVVAGITFLWNKRNEALERLMKDQIEYYRIRNLRRNHGAVPENNSATCITVALPIAQTTVNEPEVKTDPVKLTVVIDETPLIPVAADTQSAKPNKEDTTEVNTSADADVVVKRPITSHSVNDDVQPTPETVEPKRLVTVAMEPLYDHVGGSYDMYLQ